MERKQKEALIEAEKRHAGNLEVLSKDWDQRYTKLARENEELRAQLEEKCKRDNTPQSSVNSDPAILP